jgi:subtilisin family serine protease
MLGACLIPFGAHAAPVDGTDWYFGSAIEPATEAVPAEYWLVNYDEAATVARVPRKGPPTTPTPPTTPPTTPSTPNNTGAGILVAVVDTGIQLSHPEFAGRIAAGGKCFGTTAACSGASAQGNDNQGHGTHVAGIIAAAANGTGMTGVAPGASLLAVKVLDANGSGSYTAVAQGITYAAQSKARVISMSLGGSSPSSTLVAPLQTAAASAVIVAAAGQLGGGV